MGDRPAGERNRPRGPDCGIAICARGDCSRMKVMSKVSRLRALHRASAEKVGQLVLFADLVTAV